MNDIERFRAYAEAFDRAYEDGEWSAVAVFFTEDALFVSEAAAPLDARVKGRDAIIERFATTVAQFDHCFDEREMKFLKGPLVEDTAVWARFEARYAIGGAPDLVFAGEMRAEFVGDRMRRLRDIIPQEQTDTLIAWLNQHMDKLRAGEVDDQHDK